LYYIIPTAGRKAFMAFHEPNNLHSFNSGTTPNTLTQTGRN